MAMNTKHIASKEHTGFTWYDTMLKGHIKAIAEKEKVLLNLDLLLACVMN